MYQCIILSTKNPKVPITQNICFKTTITYLLYYILFNPVHINYRCERY